MEYWIADRIEVLPFSFFPITPGLHHSIVYEDLTFSFERTGTIAFSGHI
jgi:hypothetical protein